MSVLAITEQRDGKFRKVTYEVLSEGRRMADSLGTELQAPQASFTVGGVSPLFTAIFGALVLLAIAAIVIGFVFYFRQKVGRSKLRTS